MQIGEVVGQAVSTGKHPTLAGVPLLGVPVRGQAGPPHGEPVLAIDTLGAAQGSRVLVTTDAVLVRELTGARNSPIRWSVMGLADE